MVNQQITNILSDFFRINLPYGIAKNENGEWMAFNREYLPLGFNNTNITVDINSKSEYPIHTKYKNIKEATLERLADQPSAVRRDSKGKICTVWFYDDKTNPSNDKSYWDQYVEQLKTLAAFKSA